MLPHHTSKAKGRPAARSCSTRSCCWAVTQLPFCAGAFGLTYLGISMVLGAVFIAGAVVLFRRADRRSALRLYLYSLAYLAALFAAMVVDVRL